MDERRERKRGEATGSVKVFGQPNSNQQWVTWALEQKLVTGSKSRRVQDEEQGDEDPINPLDRKRTRSGPSGTIPSTLAGLDIWLDG